MTEVSPHRAGVPTLSRDAREQLENALPRNSWAWKVTLGLRQRQSLASIYVPKKVVKQMEGAGNRAVIKILIILWMLESCSN